MGFNSGLKGLIPKLRMHGATPPLTNVYFRDNSVLT
jgi:hypothetical protein